MNDGHRRAARAARRSPKRSSRRPRQPSSFDCLYPLDAPIAAKIEAIAKRVYGADGIFLLKTAKDKIAQLRGTSASTSCRSAWRRRTSRSRTTRALTNAPTGFTVTVRDLRAYTGAGWIVALCGDMQTMPGYGSKPAAINVDIDEEGRTVGLLLNLDSAERRSTV